jgi:hypothetical protein
MVISSKLTNGDDGCESERTIRIFQENPYFSCVICVGKIRVTQLWATLLLTTKKHMS